MDSFSGTLRALFRFAVLFFLAGLFVGDSLRIAWLVREKARRRRRLCALNACYARVALRVMGLRLRVLHPERLAASSGTLIVANHLSYLDILALAVACPGVFVATADLLEIPIVGPVCRSGGALFVARKVGDRLVPEIEQMSVFLAEGWPLIVFPEACASDGEGVRGFKPAPFEAARRAGAEVLAVCLRYPEVHGRRTDRRTRDRVFWYGAMTFYDHFLRLLSIPDAVIEVEAVSRRNARGISRKTLAGTTRDEIASVYGAPFMREVAR